MSIDSIEKTPEITSISQQLENQKDTTVKVLSFSLGGTQSKEITLQTQPSKKAITIKLNNINYYISKDEAEKIVSSISRNTKLLKDTKSEPIETTFVKVLYLDQILNNIKNSLNVSSLTIPDFFKKSPECMFEACQIDGKALALADDTLKKDISFLTMLVQENGMNLEFIMKYAHPDLKNYNNKNFQNIILHALKNDGMALEFVDKQYRNDSKCALTALSQNEKAIVYLDQKIIQQYFEDVNFMGNACLKNPKMTKHIPKKLLEDEKFLTNLCRKDSSLLLQKELTFLTKNPDFMGNLVKLDFLCGKYLDESLRLNEEFMFKLIDAEPSNIQYAATSLKMNPKFIDEAIKRTPNVFRYVEGFKFRQN